MKVFIYKWREEKNTFIVLENERRVNVIENGNKMRVSSLKEWSREYSWNDICKHLSENKGIEFAFLIKIPKNSTVVYEIKKQLPELFL